MEEQEPSKQYLKGFNSGYVLAEHKPELLNSIMNSFPDKNIENDFVLGLEHGHDTYEKERSKDKDIKKKRGINLS